MYKARRVFSVTEKFLLILPKQLLKMFLYVFAKSPVTYLLNQSRYLNTLVKSISRYLPQYYTNMLFLTLPIYDGKSSLVGRYLVVYVAIRSTSTHYFVY